MPLLSEAARLLEMFNEIKVDDPGMLVIYESFDDNRALRNACCKLPEWLSDYDSYSMFFEGTWSERGRTANMWDGCCIS